MDIWFQIVGLTLLVALPLSAHAECGAQREAERQADFARVELGEQKWERALKSAESALRLCPDYHEALLLKAQAYEGGGESSQSEATLQAVLEVGSPALRERAEKALNRVRDDGVIRVPFSEGPDVLIASTDPEPFRERVTRALDEAHCGLAISAAEELRRAAPDQPEGWALLAQGFKCARRTRDAVLVIDRAESLGGLTEDLDALRRQLRGSLASLDVGLEGAQEEEVIASFWIQTPDQRIDPTSRSATDSTFRDIPSGVPVTIHVRGRGLEPTSKTVDSLTAGEVTSISIRTSYAGLGTIAVADFDPNIVGALVAESAGQLIPLTPGSEELVTAGPVTLLVGDNPDSPVRVEQVVPREGALEFDPTPLRPTRLSVSGVPAGTLVRVSVEADSYQVTQFEQTLPDAGSIDEETGLRVAGPVRFDGLVGGEAGLAFSHPNLGVWRRPTALIRGQSNGLDGRPDEDDELAQLERIQSAWGEWQEERDRLRRGLKRRSMAAGVVGGVLLAGGAFSVALAADKNLARLIARRNKTVATELGVNISAGEEEGNRYRLVLGVFGGVGMGMSTTGFVLSGVFGKQANRIQPTSGPWDPWSIENKEE